MRLVLIGPPGSGKGTQAERLTTQLKLTYIGTGGILRDAIRQKSESGRLAEPYMQAGTLVPDELVNRLVADLFSGPHPPTQFVLDGYPRTVAQAIWFNDFLAERGMKLDAVVQFVIQDEEVVSRIAGRRICSNPECGASYHVTARPPKVDGVCNVCGSPLMQRADDTEKTIRKRLKVFHETTDLLVDHYRAMGLLVEIPTVGKPDQIYAHMMQLLTPQPGNG